MVQDRGFPKVDNNPNNLNDITNNNEAERNSSKLSTSKNKFWSLTETRLSYLSSLSIENNTKWLSYKEATKKSKAKSSGRKVYRDVSFS